MEGTGWSGERTFPGELKIHISQDWRLPTLPKKAAGLAHSSVSNFNGSAGPASVRCLCAFRDGSALWRFRQNQPTKSQQEDRAGGGIETLP